LRVPDTSSNLLPFSNAIASCPFVSRGMIIGANGER
jgi:hypothetical protein